jgi:hypothetical protein
MMRETDVKMSIPKAAAILLLVLPTAASLAAAGYSIEPKLALSPDQELKVNQDARSVVISGATFAYTFSRENGLIISVRVLGREIADGTPIPDLVLAEHLDRTFSSWAAGRETQARVSVVSAEPERVVLRSEGAYTSGASASAATAV